MSVVGLWWLAGPDRRDESAVLKPLHVCGFSPGRTAMASSSWHVSSGACITTPRSIPPQDRRLWSSAGCQVQSKRGFRPGMSVIGVIRSGLGAYEDAPRPFLRICGRFRVDDAMNSCRPHPMA